MGSKTIRNFDYYELLQNYPLVKHLRGKLFHVTSLENYRSIKQDGFLKPNNGSLVGVYKRIAPGATVCEKLNGISLFDFNQSDEMIFPLSNVTGTIYDYFLEWGHFLWWYKPVTVILVFDHDMIRSNLSTYEECKSLLGQWIYNVEVCHKGPIPVSAIEESILVNTERKIEATFRVFPQITLE